MARIAMVTKDDTKTGKKERKQTRNQSKHQPITRTNGAEAKVYTT